MRPGIRKCLLPETFNIWRFRLRHKLQQTDPRGIYAGDHCQRLFPAGGLILVAEDTFQDPETTAILIYWLNAFLKVEKNYKMILPPDAWNRLKEKLERTESPEETCFLLSIIASIKKTNSTDPQSPFFREESLNPSNINQRNSNILSLSLPGWGSRSENDHPAIPKGLSQQERDIDHLAEAFAGWTLTKSALFRRMMIISSVKSRPLQERWHSWGHLISYTPDSFFRLFKIRRETIIKILRENRLAQSHSLPAEPTSTSNISAPGTTGTPVDNPANTEQDEYWRRPSEFRQSNSYQ